MSAGSPVRRKDGGRGFGGTSGVESVKDRSADGFMNRGPAPPVGGDQERKERAARMRNIAEASLLLRTRVELPNGLKLATEEFREGWEFVRTGKARGLKKKIQTLGWNFIKAGDGSLKSGVGDTSQEAIASALKLALRRVSEQFNAVEVEHIQLTQYPWFFLARVWVNPYRIQADVNLPVADGAPHLQIAARERRLPVHSAALFPEFGSAMPLLKELLVSSRGSGARAQ